MNERQRVSSTGFGADGAVLDAIRQRRAVRAYGPQTVGRDSILQLLDAAVRAPTAVHEEPWAFVLVQDGALLKRLSDEAKASMDDPIAGVQPASTQFVVPQNIFYDAGTLIVIYGKPLSRFVVADCWLAAENLMLAACALGLGTCVIGLAVSALNMPQWKAEFNVPPEMTAYAPIIVGVPRAVTPPTSRKEPQILAWR